MKYFTRLALFLALACLLEGCTSFLIQQQGKHWPSHYRDCPKLYTITRMELAALSWAVTGDPLPANTCLAHYYTAADQDGFYRDINRTMTPFYTLSLPADLLLDTITLPFTAPSALADP